MSCICSSTSSLLHVDINLSFFCPFILQPAFHLSVCIHPYGHPSVYSICASAKPLILPSNHLFISIHPSPLSPICYYPSICQSTHLPLSVSTFPSCFLSVRSPSTRLCNNLAVTLFRKRRLYGATSASLRLTQEKMASGSPILHFDN